MRWNPAVIASICVASVLVPPCLAQDSPEDKSRRIALYVETGWGNVSATDINTSIRTGSTAFANSEFSLNDNAYGRAVVGWKLPKEKGSFRLRFEGFKENDYDFSTVGQQALVVTVNPADEERTEEVTGLVTWWTVHAEPGRTSSARTPPIWVESSDDANGNGRPDPGEIRYATDSQGHLVTDLAFSTTAPENLQNRLQTVDAYYLRRFGGRRTRAEWTAGLRYLVYKGNVPAAAWLNNLDIPGGGFTDGGMLPLMSYSQDSSGVGPCFSLELQQGFFRDRLVLYGQGRGAFVVQSLKSDSGRFYTIVRDVTSAALIPVEARLVDSVDKATWNTGVELGLRVELLEGFRLGLAYTKLSYQDLVLLPTAFAIPTNPGQAIQRTDAIYNTQNVVFDGWFANLSFQF